MGLLENLVVACADAPLAAQRQLADALLGQELVARVNGTNRQYDLSRFLLDGTGNGGAYRAGVYGKNLPPTLGNVQALGGGTSGSQTPADPSIYAAALADVTAQGTALITEITTQVSTFFTPRRRSVRAVAASGGLYPLEFFPTQEPGGTEPSDGAFRFNTGNWTIRFVGTIYSWNPANPATLSISLSGATRTAVRTPAQGTTPTAEELLSLGVPFDVQVTASFGVATVVFMQNNSAFDQYAVGTIYVAH